jgi:hypothetical protein
MAYIRTRTKKAGTISSALVESFRDEQGRPRLRLLANLHGEPTLLRALARLAARREALRMERDELASQAIEANKFYEIATAEALQGRPFPEARRGEIRDLMRKRERLLRRIAQVEADLGIIQKDYGIIKSHCTATPDEIQKAINLSRDPLRWLRADSPRQFGRREGARP